MALKRLKVVIPGADWVVRLQPLYRSNDLNTQAIFKI